MTTREMTPEELADQAAIEEANRPPRHILDHYRNRGIYIARLRRDVKRIIELLERPDVMAQLGALQIARNALDVKNEPPHPLAHLYDDGPPTGHPHVAYMDFLRVEDEYCCPICLGKHQEGARRVPFPRFEIQGPSTPEMLDRIQTPPTRKSG